MTTEFTPEPTPPAQQPTAEPVPPAEIEQLRAEIERLQADALRERADLDNQRKRMAREVESARKFANERLLGDLLPVFDSLEAGLAVSDADSASLREGMQLTLRQLLKVAADHGLQPVDPAGAAFDANQHQAISLVDSPEHTPGDVVQVFQKGWTLNDRLLRPALVLVAEHG